MVAHLFHGNITESHDGYFLGVVSFGLAWLLHICRWLLSGGGGRLSE